MIIESTATSACSTVGTLDNRGRIYLSDEERLALSIKGSGYGTEIDVVAVVDRTPQNSHDDHNEYEVTHDTVTLHSYGEFVLPQQSREYLGVEDGDTVDCYIERAE